MLWVQKQVFSFFVPAFSYQRFYRLRVVNVCWRYDEVGDYLRFKINLRMILISVIIGLTKILSVRNITANVPISQLTECFTNMKGLLLTILKRPSKICCRMV